MADFVQQELKCSYYNYYSIVGGTQFTVPEACSAVGGVHCNNAKESGTFNESVPTQVVNISPPETNIGRRHCSYVSEAAQLEVDGINAQTDVENHLLKDSSSSASWPKDIEQVFDDLIPVTDEITSSGFWDIVNGVVTDNFVDLPNIYNHELADVTGCSSTLLPSPVPEKEPYPNSLLAVAPSGPSNTVKCKAHRQGNKDKAPPSEAPKKKKKCLWQEGPFADKGQEKRRKDALRAKRNREHNKVLKSRVSELEKELADYKHRCEALEKILSERGLGNLYSPA